MLREAMREVLATNRANGWKCLRPQEWESEKKVGMVLMLIVTEVAEAMEAVRHNDKANFVEELADVVIRVMDCAGGLGLDLDSAIRAKMEKNKTRGFRHGGKRC